VYSVAIRGLEPRLLLLDASGRCLLRLRHYYSTDEEAAQLAATLRVPLDTKLGSGLASASRLRKTIPGAVSWPEAHPYPVIGALILPMLAIVSLIVWVLNDFK
jgi:hypothetical protein